MRAAIALFVLGLFSIQFQASAETVRYVFKGQLQSLQMRHPLQLKTMTFGLTERQMRQINDLTQGEVDFSNIHYFDADRSLQSSMSRDPNYSGTFRQNVPPPNTITSGDPELANQWWIDQLHVKKAWEAATGKGVTIADCDAGFDYTETDLQSNILVDLAHDFADPDHPTRVDDGPYEFHGTAVASIMVGVLDGKGTNGIAFNAKLVPFQNYNYDGDDKVDKEEATAACILQAIKTPGVSIIVLENQTETGSSETFVGTREAVRLALKAGITVVSAGGNAAVELREEVKDDTGSIIVGAIDPNDKSESFSNWGSRITVGAYGEKLHTLYGPAGAFGEFGGTSGATPQVAATVALIKEVNPLLTPQQVKDILLKTRVVNNDNAKTGGRLDSAAAVEAAKSAPAQLADWANLQVFRGELTTILN